MENYLDGLNEKQKEAVLHKNGPLLIIAGAGAGKTKTLTTRVLNLIKSGIAPQNILAITFTNKAAKEMRDRIHHLLANDRGLNFPVSSFDFTNNYQLTTNNSPFVGTFHYLGVHILKENTLALGISRHFSIFDRGDSLRAIKEAEESAGVNPKDFEPSRILSAISREKGNMVTAREFSANADREYIPGIIASVWEKYEAILAREKALDFDDLLLKTALLLRDNKEVRERYQKIWTHIHIDEYQDTNRVQYIIAKLLAEKERNICVVGDADQCLLPQTRVATEVGYKKIKNIKTGEKIIAASGRGDTCLAMVKRVRQSLYNGEIVEVKTKSGKLMRLTPNHLVFSKLTLTSNIYYVYLMYQKRLGFRIGIVQGSRKNGMGAVQIGFLVRCNQEKADRIWILKVCSAKEEAHYFEMLFSSRYGIPVVVFHICGRRMIIGQKYIDLLYKEIDTRKKAEILFKDTGLLFEHPHYFPQGTNQSNANHERINVHLVMFSDPRKSARHPWGLNRVSINTTNPLLRRKLEKSGFKTRKGKNADWRLEICKLDYGKAEEITNSIKKIAPETTVVRTALLTKNKRFLFQPASNLYPTMQLAVLHKGKVIEDEVVSVNKKTYNGTVYDLDIDYVHNYSAEDIFVHNCIYSWRGADIRNILNFEKDYPEAKIVLLEENYRSTQNILSAANRVIAKNSQRAEKKLFTKKGAGEKIGLYEAYDEGDEARFTALKAREIIDSGVRPSEIALLYRANFQSRALEEAFLQEKVPYQVLGIRFFERKEVKDVLSYIKLGLNPDGMSDLKRIINVQPRGLGKLPLLKILSGQANTLSGKALVSWQNLEKLLKEIKEMAEAGEKPSMIVKVVVEKSGMGKNFKEDGPEGEERLENIKELVTFALKYDAMPKEEALEKFLADSALAGDQDELLRNHDSVKLLTVHSAKGLEFDYVFVTGLEDGLFPHAREDEPRKNENKTEEERRLFYVALTRARKKLFLSYTSVRTIFGRKQINLPSEYIFDIDEELLHKEERFEGGGKVIYLD